MNKITRIDINLPMHGEWYVVGKELANSPHGNSSDDKRIITRIVDASLEYSDSFTHIIQIYVGDDGMTLAKEFINTPMSITYGDGS